LKTFDYNYFYNANHTPELSSWLTDLTPLISEESNSHHHGHLGKWLTALHTLPQCTINNIDVNNDFVTANIAEQEVENLSLIETKLKELIPWRKGPFKIGSITIDSEWKSFVKWNRLSQHISPLTDRNVLDIGCGNGYYGYRMLGAGAATVVGVDPGELFCTQFLAINHFIKTTQLGVLPLTGEMIFDNPYPFDTVFSMGVLSHRRDPQEHLQGLMRCLRPGGELVLETLVIESATSEPFKPKDRYANMRNIWQLPSAPLLCEQLELAGFESVRCVDIARTTTEEQRSTPWMPSYSLANGLDAKDQSLTIEGYPAPTRAVIIANKPT